MRNWYRTSVIRAGRRADRGIECWWADGEARRLPPVGVIVVSDDAGSRHGDGWDGSLDLLSLTLDVTTARDIGVDRHQDGRRHSSNDLLLGLSVRVTWLHAWQEARHGGRVDGEVLSDVVGEDVHGLIASRSGGVFSFLTAKVRVHLELQLGGAALGDEGLEEIGDFLLALAEGLDQVECQVLVAVAVERGGEAAVADAGGATWEGMLVGGWEREGRGLTNAVGILLDTAKVGVGKVKVDDVHDVLDVETASGDSGSDKDANGTDAEGANGVLTLALGTIGVDRGRGHADVVQVVIELVSTTLAVDKHNRTGGGTRVQQVKESLALGGWLDIDDVLLDVGGCGSSTADADAHEVVGEVLLCKITGGLGEGRGEHHVGDVAILLVWKVLAGVQSGDRSGDWRRTYRHRS